MRPSGGREPERLKLRAVDGEDLSVMAAVLQDALTCISEMAYLKNDDRFMAALSDLFAVGAEPLRVIRLKELYERLERSIDRCEDAANILEAIVIKNV